MTKIILVIVVLIMAVGVLYGATQLSASKNDKKTSVGVPKSGPSATVTPRIQNGQQVTEEQKEEAKKQLYQTGVNVDATVDTVYPGIGFVVIDSENTRMFVYWTRSNNLPTVGQNVSIKGTIARVSENLSKLQSDPDHTTDLDNFLKDQKIYIEAQTVVVS